METDSTSHDEDESNHPQPLTALYLKENALPTKHRLKEKCSHLEQKVTPQQCKENFECMLSGFVIDPTRPHLGASAHEIGTNQQKCPFKRKDVIPKAAKRNPDFCQDDKGHLKETHAYCMQIQAQVHVHRMEV